jgi:spore germination protein YaaH
MKYTLFALLLFSSSFIFSQENDSLHIGIHQVQNALYRNLGDSLLKRQVPFLAKPSPLLIRKKLELSRKVLGWHPYWAAANAYQNYNYEVLTHIAYFSYDTDTLTGGYKTINGWDQTPIIDYAHQRGVKVLLTVTNFGTTSNNALLKDTVRQNNMIQKLIELLKSRNGDGVNFDLELVSLAHRANLVSFIGRAVKKIKAELPDAEISMATPAVDWSGSWDLASLAGLCDYLIVMGYDYYWSGSSTAGPVSPMEGENYNVTKSVDYYLGGGVPANKLMLGTPWFGYNWPVVSNVRKATATGKASSVTYTVANAFPPSYGKTFDPATKVPWISYKDASNLYHQIWFDDLVSYNYKYDLVNSRNLAGIGIWALSYENGDATIWNGIRSAFSTTDVVDLPQFPKDIDGLSVFPNPSTGIVNISFTLQKQQNVEMKLLDSTGRLIYSLVNKELPAEKFSFVLNGSKLNSGLYFLVFRTKERNITHKILFQTR